MTRTACAALLLLTACAANPAQPTWSSRAVEPGAPPPPVAHGGEVLRLGPGDRGFKRPQPSDESCLAVALGRASGAAGVDNKVRFAVLRDGSLARFSYLAPVTDGQAERHRGGLRLLRVEPRARPGRPPGGGLGDPADQGGRRAAVPLPLSGGARRARG